jgi:hypothetical protein
VAQAEKRTCSKKEEATWTNWEQGEQEPDGLARWCVTRSGKPNRLMSFCWSALTSSWSSGKPSLAPRTIYDAVHHRNVESRVLFFPVTHPEYPEWPLTLVVVRRKGEKPWYGARPRKTLPLQTPKRYHKPSTTVGLTRSCSLLAQYAQSGQLLPAG